LRCSNDAFSGLGVISEKISTFDKKRVVEVTPTWVANDSSMGVASTKIGARWSESSPGFVTLILKNDSTVNSSDAYKNYESISVNIDGDIKKFPVAGATELQSSDYNTVTNTIYTESTALVIIPLEYLRNMVEAKDVRLRFESIHRYDDGVFSRDTSDYGQKLAKARIIEFLKLIVQ